MPALIADHWIRMSAPPGKRELSETMSLSELIEARFDSANTILGTFSLFFTIISAYIAALYFFLCKAPVPMRVIALVLLSISFLFLAVVVANVTEVVEVLISRWVEAAIPVAPDERLRTWLAGWASDYLLYYGGVALTTIVGIAVYVVLGYLTFLYSWPHLDSAARD
jgi:hypothetical protein